MAVAPVFGMTATATASATATACPAESAAIEELRRLREINAAIERGELTLQQLRDQGIVKDGEQKVYRERVCRRTTMNTTKVTCPHLKESRFAEPKLAISVKFALRPEGQDSRRTCRQPLSRGFHFCILCCWGCTGFHLPVDLGGRVFPRGRPRQPRNLAELTGETCPRCEDNKSLLNL